MALRTYSKQLFCISKRVAALTPQRSYSRACNAKTANEDGRLREPKDILFDSSLWYPDILENLRHQAKHSILLQVDTHGKQNPEALLNKVTDFCSKVGEVLHISPHYMTVKDGVLCSYLVEFRNIDSIHQLSSKSKNGDLRNRIAKLKPTKFNASAKGSPAKSIKKSKQNTLLSKLMTAKSISEQADILFRDCSASNVNLRSKLFLNSLVEDFFRREMRSNFTALPFGTSMCGISSNGSDLDISLSEMKYFEQFNNTYVPKNVDHLTQKGTVEYRDLLRSGAFGLFCDSAEQLPKSLPGAVKTTPINAVVPVLSFYFAPLSINLDVSLRNVTGVKFAWCLNTLVRYDTRVAPFLFLVKAWGKHRGITQHGDSTYAGLTPFMLMSLALFYLMRVREPVIPNLLSLTTRRSSKSLRIDGFGVDLVDLASSIEPSKNTSSVEELFFGFLEYYIRFSFDHYGTTLSNGKAIAIDRPVVILYPFSKDNIAKACSLTAVEHLKNEAQKTVLLLESHQRNKKNNRPWGLMSFLDKNLTT